MDHQSAMEIIACLPRERTLFHYYRDRYSVGLLRAYACAPVSISHLKCTPFAALLQKPRIKNILAKLGSNTLTDSFLNLYDYDASQVPFVLTLGIWGGERAWRSNQTSRPGFNLVLQLNFCKQHDQILRPLGAARDAFGWHFHPISSRRNTLAWSRLDIDLTKGTALIEEIQSDWIREVISLEKAVARKLAQGADPGQPTQIWGLNCTLRVSQAYCRFVLDGYQAIWAEAILWATVEFLKDEIGLTRIYYHSSESGAALKHITGITPPVSLYSDLPRRFCFQQTSEAPSFILSNRQAAKTLNKKPDIRFYCLDFARANEGLYEGVCEKPLVRT